MQTSYFFLTQSIFPAKIPILFIYGGDLVSTGVVGTMCMSDWATPLHGSKRITANNTDYRPAYAVA